MDGVAEDGRRVAFLTTGRADYSSIRPVLREAIREPRLDPVLLVAGAHIPRVTLDAGDELTAVWGPLGSTYGPTELTVEWLADYTVWVHSQLTALRPDLLVITGDRYELLPAATAALLLEIPVAHISGGDITLGAIDNQVRFALSMMSSIHFVGHDSHARRLVAMGEDSDRVLVVGDPALDDLPLEPQRERNDVFDSLGLSAAPRLALLTYHAPTIAGARWAVELDAIVDALDEFEGAIVITGTNGDPRSSEVAARLAGFAAVRPNTVIRQSLGQDLYYEVLHHAAFIIGNSSSGIWEAPSVGLPAINVGDRQAGRIRAANVWDANADAAQIRGLIARAVGLDEGARRQLRSNPYAGVRSSHRIATYLGGVPLDSSLLRKTFLPSTQGDPG